MIFPPMKNMINWYARRRENGRYQAREAEQGKGRRMMMSWSPPWRTLDKAKCTAGDFQGARDVFDEMRSTYSFVFVRPIRAARSSSEPGRVRGLLRRCSCYNTSLPGRWRGRQPAPAGTFAAPEFSMLIRRVRPGCTTPTRIPRTPCTSWNPATQAKAPCT
ncbi:hypothetical protein BRADI_1g63645v3 [Brachypodium distachyon]|uniref:Uncharacterized protein n=1 Tax=Brachypodium distachyon TaxID=15368 RepID=A0A2K2DT88_BRADI|nr:hypothetical protein BRADI_1g63645v3 [Brachypodium distachyon]